VKGCAKLGPAGTHNTISSVYARLAGYDNVNNQKTLTRPGHESDGREEGAGEKRGQLADGYPLRSRDTDTRVEHGAAIVHQRLLDLKGSKSSEVQKLESTLVV